MMACFTEASWELDFMRREKPDSGVTYSRKSTIHRLLVKASSDLLHTQGVETSQERGFAALLQSISHRREQLQMVVRRPSQAHITRALGRLETCLIPESAGGTGRAGAAEP